MSDLTGPLDFYKTEKAAQSGGLNRIVKQLAFLHYLGMSFKLLHKYAGAQGYKGTYSSFTSWLRRNVDFDELYQKYEAEFKEADPRPPLQGGNLIEKTSSSAATTSATALDDAAVPQTSKNPTSPTESSEAKPGVSEPSSAAENQPSPRDILKKWQSPSYEDQLAELGIKGKHDDQNRTR